MPGLGSATSRIGFAAEPTDELHAMLNCFEKEAPIRAKFRALLVVLGALAAIALLATACAGFGWLTAGVAITIAAITLVATLATVMIAADKICTPYVTMVGCLEDLASGNTSASIPCTDYRDCVGRLARATATFRDRMVESDQERAAQHTVVETLNRALRDLADNVLDCRIEQSLPGAYEELRGNFNAAVASLSGAIGSVRNSADSVLNGATEIRVASDDLSRRNEQQAASLKETAAAMSRVTEGVKGTAKSAVEVKRSIVDAHKEATEGGAVVARAVEAMAGIECSAQEITQIINVIDGIAFHTNLLALDAGVEAARAGDAGKGFAVVANEVRALAQRSADAAKDIKALITTSTEQVGSRVTLVGETGTLLSRIVTRVGAITGLITGIADSAAEQAGCLEHVNSAVVEMDRVTQKNAAMVEQATAASRSLADEARELNGVVSRFRTGNEGRAPIAAASFVPPRANSSEPTPFVRANRRPAPPPPKTQQQASQGNLAVKQDEDWSEF